jgi:DNA (cytosine-5)-methyltransferase 1
LVAFNVIGGAHTSDRHAYETDKSGAIQGKGNNPTGNEAGTVIRSDFMVRRFTPTEVERLQGLPDGHTCTCQVRPDCPDRRIPPWVDRGKIILKGCGHSMCGCKCGDGARYRSIGNSVAVPVLEWIGRRLRESSP